jgi:hypothetical protein
MQSHALQRKYYVRTFELVDQATNVLTVKIHARGLGVQTCGLSVLTCIHDLDSEGTEVSVYRCRLFSLPLLRPTLP